MPKSIPEQIRRASTLNVERFSNLQTGQSATIDAPLVLDLITAAAASVNPSATALLDVGCGAGNYSVKLLEKIPALHVTLIDLSQPMLDRAAARVLAAGAKSATPLQGDIRQLLLPEESFNVILSAAVLHHLRSDDEWESVFAKLYRSLRPGGSIWISDLVEHDHPLVQQMMWKRYGEYLTSLKGPQYRDEVFAYVEQEDTPRSLAYQLDLLNRVGFVQVDVLHKNGPFAAFGGRRGK